MMPLKPGAKVNGKEILGGKETYFFMDPYYEKIVRYHGFNETMDRYYKIFSDIKPSEKNRLQSITGEATPMYVVGKSITTYSQRN